MIENLVFLLVFLAILIRCAGYAIKYSSRLSRALHLPEFIVSFFIVALISVLPEATVSIISAFKGEPELGLGTLLGSNVADLGLVFGVVSLFSSHGIKVKSKILSNNFYFLILLLLPVLLGLDGKFSRTDGLILILLGALFFVKVYLDSHRFHKKFNHTKREPFLKSLIFLIISLVLVFLSAFFTVKFAVSFANYAGLPPLLIGVTILAMGSCLPELIFSIKAVRINRDGLALGDVLGTVIADATIILGLVALISPFNYNVYNLYVTGLAMFLAGLFAIIFMKSDRTITKREGVILISFYVVYILIEIIVNSV